MIAHATPTPTQMALHQARKARQAHQARMASRLKANDNKPPRVVMRLPAPVKTIAEMCGNSTRWEFVEQRSRHYGVSVDAIIGSRGSKRTCFFRQVIMLELRETLGLSYAEIGKALGGRDHTTVIHGLERAREARETGRKAPPQKASSRPKPMPIAKPVKQNPRKVRDHIKRITKDQEDQIVILWRDHGLSYAEICRQLCVADKAPRRVIASRGITR